MQIIIHVNMLIEHDNLINVEVNQLLNVLQLTGDKKLSGHPKSVFKGRHLHRGRCHVHPVDFMFQRRLFLLQRRQLVQQGFRAGFGGQIDQIVDLSPDFTQPFDHLSIIALDIRIGFAKVYFVFLGQGG